MCPSLTYFSAADASWRILTDCQCTSCHSSYIFFCCHFLGAVKMQLFLMLNDPGSIRQLLPCRVTLLHCQWLFPPSHSSSISELLWFAAWSADLCQPQLIKSDTSFETASRVCHALPKSARTLFHLFFFFFLTIQSCSATCFSNFHSHMLLSVKTYPQHRSG